MIKMDIAPASPVTGYQGGNYLMRFSGATSLKGSSVLCIGFSDAQVHEWVMPFSPSEVVRLTYWDGHVDAVQNDFELVMGDICRHTPIPDKRFDWILTSSVFEHLGNIEGACREIKRISKNGGMVGIQFGPVWSSSEGHHLYLNPGDPYLDFSLRQLPSHWHLRFYPWQIRNYFILVGKELQLDMIHQFVFRSRIINRFMWEDYMDVFSRNFGKPTYQEIFAAETRPCILQELRCIYKPYTDFDHEGGNLIFHVD
jgi:SAM-dependent methyltransferase